MRQCLQWLVNKSASMQETGELYGDPFEVSTIRREDYQLNKDKAEYVDVLQCNSLPSTRTPRGHQFPGAFLNWVSSRFSHEVCAFILNISPCKIKERLNVDLFGQNKHLLTVSVMSVGNFFV